MTTQAINTPQYFFFLMNLFQLVPLRLFFSVFLLVFAGLAFGQTFTSSNLPIVVLQTNGATIDDEYEWSAKIANTFVKELKQYGKLIHYQREYNGPYKDLALPVVAKTDFEFNDYIVDTKATAKVWRYAATKAEKNQGKKGRINHNYHPKPDHLRQQFLYRELFGKDCLLLYASPWDNHTSDLGDHVGYLEQLINAFKSIEHILGIAKTKEDVVRMFPLTFDNWRWKYSPGAESFARKIWQNAWK